MKPNLTLNHLKQIYQTYIFAEELKTLVVNRTHEELYEDLTALNIWEKEHNVSSN